MIEYDTLYEPSEAMLLHHYNPLFWIALGVAEALLFGAVLPLLLFYCIYFRDGFAWDATNQYATMFNVHPLTMVLGFIILYSQGVLIYRILPLPKLMAKIAHAVIHVGVLICAIVGYVSVFKFHHVNDINDLFSLHSWLGIITGALFLFQLGIGLVTYLNPATPLHRRSFIMPFHRFGGIAIFALSVVTCISGLQEKISFGLGKHSCKSYMLDPSTNQTVCLPWSIFDKAPEEVVLNNLGVAICLAVGMVAFIATRPDWQRRNAAESETVKLLGAN